MAKLAKGLLLSPALGNTAEADYIMSSFEGVQLTVVCFAIGKATQTPEIRSP